MNENQNQDPREEALQTIQDQYAGVRLSKGKMGTRKTLDRGQKDTAAEQFDADSDFIGASKKLLNTRDPAFSRVTKILSDAGSYFKNCTLPYPEDGTRLVKRTRLEEFQCQMESFRAQLETAVEELGERMDELKLDAQQKLGRLYNEGDYPKTLRGLFRIAVDYPNLTPPDYLKQANPKLYEEQSRRIAARFDQAVSLAEEAFTEELSAMISTLQRKLQGLDDGTEKRLKESTIDNLEEFFGRFKKLNLHSSVELDKIVDDAQGILSGKNLFGQKPISRDDLRNSQAVRTDVRTRLSAVAAELDGLMVVKPRRNITRRAKEQQEQGANTETAIVQEPKKKELIPIDMNDLP